MRNKSADALLKLKPSESAARYLRCGENCSGASFEYLSHQAKSIPDLYGDEMNPGANKEVQLTEAMRRNAENPKQRENAKPGI